MKPSCSSSVVTQDRITLKERIYYGFPAGVTSMLFGGPLVVLQGVYAQYYGLALTTIASILLLSRLFDTVTDPIIGYYSDKYFRKSGSRKLFVFSGSVIFIIGAYLLFVPVLKVTASYTLVCLLLFYLGYTLFNIPHYAWGSEISRDSTSSTQVYTIRAMMMGLGTLVFYALPQTPIFDTPEYTPDVLRWTVIVASLLLVPAIFLCLRYVPTSCGINGDVGGEEQKDRNFSGPLQDRGLISTWNQVKKNKPFLIFLSAFVLWGVGIGSWSGLLFIYISSYLEMGKYFSLAALIGLGASIACAQIFSRLANLYGKIKAWILSSLLTAASMLSMAFLEPVDTNFWFLVTVMTMAYLGSISYTIVAPALLSDIVDYSAWKFGDKLTGSYFSIYFFAWKTNEAIGVAMGLAIAGWFGFDPSQTEHTSEAIAGLKLASIWIPAFLFMLTMLIISRIPINARRHAIVCQALARRSNRKEESKSYAGDSLVS